MANKIINSKCVCNIGLQWKQDEIIVIIPCEHLFHKNCIYLFIKHYKAKCPYCDHIIKDILTIKDFGSKMTHQQYIDILSVSNYSQDSRYFISTFFDNIFRFVSMVGSVPFLEGVSDGEHLTERIFSLCNAEIKVIGLDKIIHDKKVFIANHTSYLDLGVIFYILKTGFLASSFTTESQLGRKFSTIMPTLIIKRGKSENTVNKIKDYVDKNGSICIFPEGMLTHPRTITRFRTGAFMTGFPVYGLTLLFDPLIADGNIPKFMIKLASQVKTKITLHITGPYMPPFSEVEIENVRQNMAKPYGLFLSRVSNKDISDK